MANQIAINAIDAMLSGNVAPGKGYPEAIYGFPEYTQENLKHFIDVFSVPSGAVPTRRQKKNYLVWTQDLDELEKLCGTEKRVRRAYEIAKERYDTYSPEFKFILWRPLGDGMRKLIIASIMQMNEEEKELKEKLEKEKRESERTLVSVNKFKSLKES